VCVALSVLSEWTIAIDAVLSHNDFFSARGSSACLVSAASSSCRLSYTVKLDMLALFSVDAVTGGLSDISDVELDPLGLIGESVGGGGGSLLSVCESAERSLRRARTMSENAMDFALDLDSDFGLPASRDAKLCSLRSNALRENCSDGFDVAAVDGRM
jgi:hypothetical protein